MIQPSKRRRTIVSVAFSPEQFQEVAKAASRRGVFVSAFIREAALEESGPVLAWFPSQTTTYALSMPRVEVS